MQFRLLSIGLILAASPALADQRGYSVTSFTRIRVEGPVTVIVETGRSPGAQAEGDRQAIDRIRVESSGDVLMVGIDRTNWTGDAPVNGRSRGLLRVTTPTLDTLSVIGAGNVSIDRVIGPRFTLTLTGSGRAAVDGLNVDQLTVGINGSAAAKLAGKAKQAKLRSQGQGQIDGAGLTADDADVSVIGAGDIHIAAARSARTMLKGSGRIAIDGDPACSGTSEGSGEVICGP